MGLTKQEKEGRAWIKLDGRLSIDETAEYRDAIVECLKENTGLFLDLSEISECDTAGIQLLWSTRKTAESGHKSFSVEGASDPVVAAANRIGIEL